ncbi:MAG: LysE family translocator [Peptococcaceae bacterium]
MEIGFLMKGIVIGFSIAAPVGPICVLCIKRTLDKGRIYGLVSGLGAATADAIYGSIGAFGLTFISNFLIDRQFWLQLVGGLFLCYLGVKTFISKSQSQEKTKGTLSIFKAYASTFLLTITNPQTILFFTAIFAGLGLGSINNSYSSAALLIAGVFTGSALWWLILSSGVDIFRKKFTIERMLWVNRISGVIIAGFGIYALLSLIDVF